MTGSSRLAEAIPAHLGRARARVGCCVAPEPGRARCWVPNAVARRAPRVCSACPTPAAWFLVSGFIYRIIQYAWLGNCSLSGSALTPPSLSASQLPQPAAVAHMEPDICERLGVVVGVPHARPTLDRENGVREQKATYVAEPMPVASKWLGPSCSVSPKSISFP